MPLFEPIFAALNEAGARYVVVGGVAVVLHGHPRLTADLDLAVDLAPDQAGAAIGALVEIGFEPRLPVDPMGFAEAEVRREWVETRNLRVFTMHRPDEPLLSVDLFADEQVPFAELWARSVTMAVGAEPVRVASIDDLVALKRAAGRPQDLADIEALEGLRRDGDG